MKHLLFILTATLLCFTSCSTTKTIKFSQKKNEVFSNSSLSEFLKKNKNPKIVLRVDNSSPVVTDGEDNNYLYQVIENTLLANNFIIRDRQLFNQIVENNKNNLDYKLIGEKSDTDLILELVKIVPNVAYETNKYYTSRNKEKVEDYGTYKRFGASVEFKVILIRNNEFAGRYKFNYTPCTSGCVVSLSAKDIRKQMKQQKENEKKPYEGVERNVLEDFIQDATQKLIDEMRK